MNSIFNIFSNFAQLIFMKNKKRKNKMVDKNDPLGAYTGTPIDGEIPIQDADDL